MPPKLLFFLLFAFYGFSPSCFSQTPDIGYQLSLCYGAQDCDSLYRFVNRVSDPNAQDSEGRSYLHHLAGVGAYCADSAIGILLRKGADVNLKDNKGRTPLDVSRFHYDSRVITRLINAGGIATDQCASSPLCRAMQDKKTGEIKRICRRFKFFSKWGTTFIGSRLAYTYQNVSLLEASCFFGLEDISYIFEEHIGISLGSEFKFGKNFFYVPKATVDYRWHIFLARAGCLYYHDADKRGAYFMGEAGISLFGFLEVSYGYVFGMKGNDFFDVSPQRLTFTLNVPLYNGYNQSLFKNYTGGAFN